MVSRRLALPVAAVAVLLLLAVGASCAVPQAKPGERTPLKVAATVHHRDVKYGPGPNQLADVYLPTAGGNKGVIVAVHGGGFTAGSRKDTAEWFGPIFAQTRRGYAVVAVTYQLTDTAKRVGLFPSAVRDVSTAVSWVRSSGATLGMNSQTVIVAGHSAGGAVAALVGVGHNSPPSGPLGVTAKVDGWVSMAGIHDFTGPNVGIRNFGNAWLGPNANSAAWRNAASATKHFDPSDPPGYLLHGDSDGIVPLDQTQAMLSAGMAAGVPTGRMFYDIVSSGPAECRNHLPQCGMNARVFGDWVDQVQRREL